MKVILLALTCLIVYNPASATQCLVNPVKIPTEWITMKYACRMKMVHQILIEINTSLQYLAMGAHFNRNGIDRPGFSKLFFEAASEERQHVMKLIEYLLMRKQFTNDLIRLIPIRPPPFSTWENGVAALEHAMRMEMALTRNTRTIISECESDIQFNDYHVVDYLTGEFLEQQYKRQRDLIGKASTLKKMMERHGSLGEFTFDKKLINKDI